MCGIHLLVDKKKTLDENPIRQMLQALQHRGPDAADVFSIESYWQTFFLASNRLKISDLNNIANQPFVSADENFVLCFNGAIYNHTELRQNLEKKYPFRTRSDTETLLYQLIEKGESGLAEINGMFAFIMLDIRQGTVHFGRDPEGMKPLYLFENESYLILSSEIKGIVASGLVEKKLNISQIESYLRFRFAQPPQTFFENIFEVETGICFTFQPGKQEQIRRQNFTLPDSSAISTPPESIETLETLLTASVVRHFRADVPAGLFLSGGVDSTLLLSLLQNAGYEHVPAFSVANEGLTQDENFARQAARQFKAEHFQIQTDSRLLLDFENFIRKTDQPIADSATWLTLLLAEEAKKQGLKVILSGAGADELSGGYNRHWAYFQYLKHYELLSSKLFFFKKSILKDSRFSRKFVQNLSADPIQTFQNFTSLSLLSPPTDGQKVKAVDKNRLMQQALTYDREHFLRQDVLRLTDQMGMQAGVEVRLPYLDAEIVQLVGSLGGNFRMQHGKKWLLKRILSENGGKKYTGRKKEGLGFPFGKWLLEPNGGHLIELLQNKWKIIYQFVDYQAVMKILNIHRSGKTDYSSELWAVTFLAGWLEDHFG
jgi:asparagine synthase (glutamine-hydrolysing)